MCARTYRRKETIGIVLFIALGCVQFCMRLCQHYLGSSTLTLCVCVRVCICVFLWGLYVSFHIRDELWLV